MRKAVDKLMTAIMFLLGILLALAVLFVVLQIVCRYMLKHPLGWTNQACQSLFVWIVMLGLPVLFHTKSVAAFDYISSKMRPKMQDALCIFTCLLSIFFAVCFMIFGWQFMMKKGGMMIPAFRVIPYYAVYVSMPISGALLFIEMILQLVEAIREFGKKKGDK